MGEWSAMLDEAWEDVSPYLVGPFTTQDFQKLVEEKAPLAWGKLVERYGSGGKGNGHFYSPNNTLNFYLKDKAKTSKLEQYGFVSSSSGWGSHVVSLWELAGTKALPPTEEDKGFIEGKQVLRTHLVRERSPGLRQLLLDSRRASGLSCDICETSGEVYDDDIRTALFEAHHKTAPLAVTGETKTTVEDMSLLCASCHRLIHRLVSARGRWFSIEEARDAL